MGKNHHREIPDEPSSSVRASSLEKFLASRPEVPRVITKVSCTLDVFRTLDGMKGGLVGIQGGSANVDAAYIIMQDDLETELLHRLTCHCIGSQLVQPVGCSDADKRRFYTREYQSKKRNPLTGEVLVTMESNGNFVGGRKILFLPSPSSKPAIFFILAYLEVLFDTFKVEFLPADESWKAFDRVSSWCLEQFVSYAKYCTAAPMARYLRNDLPTLPVGLFSWRVFSGPIAKKVRARLVSRNEKSCAFFVSLLQGVKRACDVVPRCYIEKAKLDHLTILTTPPLKPDTEFYSLFQDKSLKLFRGISLPSSSILTWTEPAKTATYFNTRADGGQDFEVREELDLLAPHKAEDDFGNVFEPVILPFFEPRNEDPGQAWRQYLIDTPDFGMRDTEFGIKEIRYRFMPKSEKRALIYKLSSTLPTYLPCRIVPLSEPLKVRTISAGPGVPYYLGKPFQKVSWSWLRKFPQFICIGEPLVPRHLTELLNREWSLDQLLLRDKGYDINLSKVFGSVNDVILCPKELWISGDFTGATDRVNIHYTLLAFDSLSARLLEESLHRENGEYFFLEAYLKICRGLLSPHEMHYTSRKGTTHIQKACKALGLDYGTVTGPDGSVDVTVRQVNGQLMGSPISFPFLCAINLIGYWISLEKFLGRSVPFRLLPVLVNGDDILFRSNPIHYDIWKSVISELGFKLSLGKNYAHREFLTMNSEFYRHNPSSVDEFKKIDFFNVGLLMAQSKGRLADPFRRLSLSELYECSVLCATDKRRAHKRFVHYNRMQILEMTDNGKYNLFIPIHLGGLGFTLHPDVKEEIYVTSFQRRFATFLLRTIQEKLAIGEYPRNYLFALTNDDNPSKKGFFRRSGIEELKLGGLEPEEGWEIFLGPQFCTLGPLSEEGFKLSSNVKYRLPSRSVLRRFNREQHAIRLGKVNISIDTSTASDKLLFHTDLRFVHRRVRFTRPLSEA